MAYNGDKINISVYAQAKELPGLKKEYTWLKEINAQSLQESLFNLDTAYKNFFTGKSDFPKFKKRNNRQSFSCPQNVSVDEGKSLLIIPKFQEGIKIILHRKFKGKIKSATVSKTPCGHYFVSILTDTGEALPQKPEPKISTAQATDTGLISYAYVGNYELTKVEDIKNPKWVREEMDRLKRLQRQLSKKKKGSKNYEKLRLKIARKHEKITRKKQDFTHKLTYKLTHDNQVGTNCVEDLNIAGLLKNHCLAGAISEVAWGEFYRQLEYKSEWYGKNLLYANRFAPTSKKCHLCHFVNKELTLDMREWDCQPPCGAHHVRDGNSCPNIIASAFDEYKKKLIKDRDGLPESSQKTARTPDANDAVTPLAQDFLVEKIA